MTDEEIRLAALEFARRNKNRIAKELTDTARYIPDSTPISVFMAGSPGAGKTEFSKNLIALLEKDADHHVVRIDADELRSLMPGYTGANSSLFQGAISFIVEKMHDLVLHNSQTFIFDSTSARHEKTIQNITRSLTKERPVRVFYVYQKPEVAWKFTQAREQSEGRNIPKAAFIEQYFGAMDTVRRIREQFGTEVSLFLVKKDFEKNTVEYIVEIKQTGKPIDEYIQERYTEDTLESML